MSFYKGYILTSGKKPIEKFKNVDTFRTFEDANTHKSFAGVLSEDSVFIDFDDTIQAELALNIVKSKNVRCRVIKTTRGYHMLFKNTAGTKALEQCYTHTPVAVGLTADIKGGFTNAIEVLKIDGSLRQVVYDTKEPYDEIPNYFLPVKSSIRDFNVLAEGDGRNETLYKYILVLLAHGYSKQEIIDLYQIINQYILASPLSEDELNKNILRDDAFNKPVRKISEHAKFFDSRNNFIFSEFAYFLIKKYNIKKINGTLHIYKDNYYQASWNEIESMMLDEIPTLNKAKRAEVLAYLDLKAPNADITNCKFICFNNGIYDLENNILLEHSPEYIITNKIPHNFNNTYSEVVNTTVRNIAVGNTRLVTLLYEMVGSVMYARNEFAKAFILCGSGSNGKSTFLTMIKNMIGSKNYSTLDLNKLDDRFSTIMLHNKLANISDDISDNYINDMATFKKVVTGETINAEQKGQPKIDFNPYCKVLLSANNVPRMGKGRDTYALKRRLLLIPFNAKFDSGSNNFNQFIADDLKAEDAMEFLIYQGIKALRAMLYENNCRFTEVDAVNEKLQEFEEDNNPTLAFFNDNDDIVGKSTEDVYNQYSMYCFNNGYQKIGKSVFIRECLKHYDDLVTERRQVNRKNIKIFVRKPQPNLIDILEKGE